MKLMGLILAVLLTSTFTGCSSGGGDDDSSELSNSACGVLGLNSRSQERIVNGTECQSAGQAPVVRLAFLNGSNQIGFCSGSMITANDVLTAAHCFLGNPNQVVMIRGDSLNPSERFVASAWSVHPDFREEGGLVVNDVAVVHLNRNTTLPTLPVLMSERVSKGEIVSIFGYGTDENGTFDFQDLESGEMRISDVTATHIAARFDGEGSNTCQGDSGGPVVSQRAGFAAIAGLTSTGTQLDCLQGDTTFFTNLELESVLTFLQRVVPDASYR